MMTCFGAVVVAALLAWKLFLSPSDDPMSHHSALDPHIVVQNSQNQRQQADHRQEIVRKRQRCRYSSRGEEVCESDEEQESRTLSGSSMSAESEDSAVTRGGDTGHQESHYRARQVCRSVNGETYCESDEHHSKTSRNDGYTAGQTSNQGYYYGRQVCRTVNGQKYCESYEEEQASSRTRSLT